MCQDFTAETEATEIYVKKFSHLGKYQQAFEAHYYLQEQENSCIIAISQTGVQAGVENVCLAISKQEALQVLCLLYENSVTLPIWRDVLDAFALPFSDGVDVPIDVK